MLRLYADAIEDSLFAAYYIAFVAPMGFIASRWMISRGSRSTASFVLKTSIMMSFLLILPIFAYKFLFVDTNAYSLLKVCRSSGIYDIGKSYNRFRELHKFNKLSEEEWLKIDEAYENLLNDKVRANYDFWGEEKTDGLDLPLNLLLYYVLWSCISYALSWHRLPAKTSVWLYPVLLGVLVLELSMKFFYYEPSIFRSFCALTPREGILWLHRLYPVYLSIILISESVFYIDLDLHQNKILRHMLDANKGIMQEIQELKRELQSHKAGTYQLERNDNGSGCTIPSVHS
ncbi:unnamed protein product [Albugo candida]|uniref:J domain-containing protein n=1 Tax=Albugo candida TaxID=65357 RepID=A0A024GSU9_9STRA|nr:unnamed protein product [Albugo candida]CCI49987.1 unnamed protein product [Albugo candida]|eukprot:CCI40342.1 unnamed protein product [Albugo candida]